MTKHPDNGNMQRGGFVLGFVSVLRAQSIMARESEAAGHTVSTPVRSGQWIRVTLAQLLFSIYAVPILAREWCHPQRAGLPTLVTPVRIILHRCAPRLPQVDSELYYHPNEESVAT